MAERALVLIDLQNDYFPGGNMALEGPDAAAANAARALEQFRSRGWPVVHVRPLSVRSGAPVFIPGTEAAEIHAGGRPREGEAVVQKNFPNSFRGTELDTL